MNQHTFVVLAYNESPFLEDCLKSLTNQTIKTNIVIATTTNNNYIKNLAKKYHLEIVTAEHTNIGGDFDFALNVPTTKLVTIAHQDDVYEKDYAKSVIKEYKHHLDSIIIFTDYYEIRNNCQVYTGLNLKIKRLLLLPLTMKLFRNTKFIKRSSIRLGTAICCPSVTFIKDNCPKKIFSSNLLCNVDWLAWEKLSRRKGKFIYINKKLVGHRIDETTTTSEIIKKGIRTKEDLIMFNMFWPKHIAKVLNKLYSNSEKSNQVKEQK